MPGRMTKNPDGSYRVATPNMVHAKHTSKANAESQIRLLNAVDHGWQPTDPYRPDNKKYERKRKKSRSATSRTGI